MSFSLGNKLHTFSRITMSSMFRFCFPRTFLVAILSASSLLMLGCGGCFNENAPPEGGAVEVPENLIPLLDEKELEELGAKNNLEALNWLPNGGSFGLIASPKKLFASKIGTSGQDLLLQTVIRATGIPVDFSKMDTLVVNAQVKIVVQPPQPGVPYSIPRPLMQMVTYVKMEAPIEKANVLRAYLPPERGFSTPRPRTVSGKELYELPVAAPLELHGLLFLDDRTFLDIRGDEEMLKECLDATPPSGPLAERMARVDVENNELTFLSTSEGSLPFGEEEIQAFSQQVPMVPETLVKIGMENFRALQLQANFSAAENTPLATLRFETTKDESAKEIAKVVNQQITYYRSGLPMLKTPEAEQENGEGEKPLQQQAYELALEALDSLTIEAKGSVVLVSFLKFPALEGIVENFFQNQRAMIQMQQEIEQTRGILNAIFQRQSAIRGYMLSYHNENGHFPSDIRDAQGNALLSWKVALLPYMGEKNLYDQFKLDESWDSENNKPLINRMPMIFCDLRSADVTRSTYLYFNSPGTPFANPELKMANVTAPGQTVMLVAVLPEHASEWTRPNSLSAGQSQEDYIKLFGQAVPLIFFDGKGGHLFWDNTPDALSQFENSVRGDTTAPTPPSATPTSPPVGK